MVGGPFLWPVLRYGTGYQTVWENRPSAETPLGIHCNAVEALCVMHYTNRQSSSLSSFTEDVFIFSLHCALELSGWCALQIYLLMSWATEFVVLSWKWAKPHNLGFSSEIVKFRLDLHFETNFPFSSLVPAACLKSKSVFQWSSLCSHYLTMYIFMHVISRWVYYILLNWSLSN